MAKLTPQQFFDKYANYAMETQILKGVPADVTLAQAALESGWGGSSLTVKANNFFGIKDFANDDWKGEYFNIATGEYGANGYYTINSNFRKYNSALDSFIDHANFLIKNKNYKSLFSLDVNDYKGWANGLKAAGYATAPNYGTTLISLIEKYDLHKYVEQAKKKRLLNSFAIVILFVGLSFGFSYYKGYLTSTRNKVFTGLAGLTAGLIFNGLINFYKQQKYS